MKFFKKLLCTCLVLTLLCATVASAFAATYIYLNSTDSDYGWGRYQIPDSTATSKITSVTSSNKAVAKITSLSRWSNKDYYYDTKETESYGNSSFNLRGYRAGNATLSYKLDGVLKKFKVYVKNYVNPVKSMMLTGVSSTANYRAKFNTSHDGRMLLKANAPAGKLKVTAATGWKIYSISWDCDGGYFTRYFGNHVSSASLDVPAMKVGKNYTACVSFVNTSNHGELNIYLDVYSK